MKKNKIILCFLILIFIPVMLSCSDNKYKKNEKVNILVVRDAIADDEEFKMIVNNYVGSGNEVNIIEVDSKDLSEKIIKDEKVDLIFSNRNTMLKLSQEGLIKELNSYYVENELLNKLDSFNMSYCRNKKSYYGVAVNPHSIVFLVNKNWADSNGINEKSNMRDILRKEIYIPYILPNNQSLDMILSAFIANNENLAWKLTENYGMAEYKFEDIESGQKIFDELNSFIKSGEFNKEKFILTNKDEINKFNNGEIPIILTSTLISSKLDQSRNVVVVDKFQTTELKTNAIVDCAGIILVASGTENNIAANNFLDYIVKEKRLENINQANIITGNKKIDDKLNENSTRLRETIVNTNENNIIYYENLTDIMRMKMNDEVEKCFIGQGNNSQWSSVIS